MLYSIIGLQFFILSGPGVSIGYYGLPYSRGYFLIKDNLLIELIVQFFVCIFCIFIKSSIYFYLV